MVEMRDLLRESKLGMNWAKQKERTTGSVKAPLMGHQKVGKWVKYWVLKLDEVLEIRLAIQW
jgi:hypothetical protein